MKKVLIVVSLVSVLLLAGCGKNEEKNNNYNNSVQGNVSEVVTNNQEQEDVNSSLDDVEKYKLSDSYELEHNAGIKFNVGDNWGEELFIADTPIEFYSSGKKHTIIAKKEDSSYLKLLIDDKEVDTISNIYSVGIIDIDEKDDFNEVVIRKKTGDIFIETNIYRINNNEQLEEMSFGDIVLPAPCYVNNKYIFPVYLYGGMNFMTYGPVIGYYTYEDGNFIYNDRLLTGEKAIDENGKFVLNIIDEFSNDFGLTIGKSGDGNLEPHVESDVTGRKFAKFRVISFSIDNNESDDEANPESDIYLQYDIELLDDAVWTRLEFSEKNGHYNTVTSDEVLKKGTIIKGVSIYVSEP